MKYTRLKRTLLIGSFICLIVLVLATLTVAATGKFPDLLSRIGFAFAILQMKEAPNGPPAALFSQYVLDPPPNSVAEIRADRTKAVFGYGYTFRFNISMEDLGLIVRSRSFERAATIECTKDSFVSWVGESRNRETLLVYGPGQRRPKWFTPDTWDNPEAYATTTGDIRILIYDEQSGEAYLIIRSR